MKTNEQVAEMFKYFNIILLLIVLMGVLVLSIIQEDKPFKEKPHCMPSLGQIPEDC